MVQPPSDGTTDKRNGVEATCAYGLTAGHQCQSKCLSEREALNQLALAVLSFQPGPTRSGLLWGVVRR